MKTWVDVPEGWKYGFPRIYDPAQDGEFRAWLLQNGYPQALLDKWGSGLWVRAWNTEEQRDQKR